MQRSQKYNFHTEFFFKHEPEMYPSGKFHIEKSYFLDDFHRNLF